MDSLVDSMKNIHHGFGPSFCDCKLRTVKRSQQLKAPENLMVGSDEDFFSGMTNFRGENVSFIL